MSTTSRRRPTSNSRAPLSNIQSKSNSINSNNDSNFFNFPDDKSTSSSRSKSSGVRTRSSTGISKRNGSNSRSSTRQSINNNNNNSLSPVSTTSKGSRTSTITSNATGRFKLKSSANDTKPIHGSMNTAAILQPPSSTTSRRVRPNSATSNNNSNKTGSMSTLNESVNEMKNAREEARLRLEWAKQRGASAEGDIMRADSGGNVTKEFTTSSQELFQQQSQTQQQQPIATNQQQQQIQQPQFSNSTFNPTPSNNAGEQTISLTESQIQELIQNKIERNENETIVALKKQVDDLKFFQELEREKQSNNQHPTLSSSSTVMGQLNAIPPSLASPSSSPFRPRSPSRSLLQHQHSQQTTNFNTTTDITQLQLDLQAAQTTLNTLHAENTNLTASLSLLREENIDLQAKLEITHLSSPEAYKKALKFKSELLEKENLLQEEILRRERAETNVECLKMEYGSERGELQIKIKELERTIEERNHDLDDGVLIVKGLEEEISITEDSLEKEKAKVKGLEYVVETCKREKQEMKEEVEARLNASKTHNEQIRSIFEKEKKDLEAKCEDFESEIQEMKQRVNEMEEKRHFIEEREEEFKKLEEQWEVERLEHKIEISRMETEHKERVRAYQKSLDGKVGETKSLQEKISAMEMIVSEYHEKARNEIKEYMQGKEDAERKATKSKKELDEARKRIEELEESSTLMETNLDELQEELTTKDSDLAEANEKVSKLSELVKAQTATKKKDHQLIRAQKKFVATEERLRKELEETKEELYSFQTQNEVNSGEIEELTAVVQEIEEENEILRKKVKALMEQNKTFKDELVISDEEARGRINSLEQELCRLQRSSPVKEKLEMRYHNGHVFMQEEKLIAEIKTSSKTDKRTEEPKNETSYRVSSRMDRRLEDPKYEREYKVSSRMDKTTEERKYEREMDRRLEDTKYETVSRVSLSSSSKTRDELMDVAWDEIEGNMTIASKASREFKERQGIENDAIRKYMRQRRTR